MTAVDAPPVAIAAAGVSEAAAVAAFFVDSSWERAANALTVGAVGALKLAAKGAIQAERSVVALEKASQAATLLEASVPAEHPQEAMSRPPPPEDREQLE